MNLNNIVKISVVPSHQLIGYSRISDSEASYNEDTFFSALEIKQPAQLTITDKIEDKQRIYTSKLTFKICKKWIRNAHHISFLVESMSGQKYLIGTDTHPYPIITQQEIHPDNYKDNQLTEVNVTYNSVLIPPIII